MKNRRDPIPNYHKRLFIFSVIVVLTFFAFLTIDSGSFFLHFQLHYDFKHLNRPHIKPQGSNLSSLIKTWSQVKAACEGPVIDPNDKMVDSYLQNVSLECPYEKPLTFLDQETGLLSAVNNSTCFYSFFQREEDADNYIVYKSRNAFTDGIVIQMNSSNNLVNTSCHDINGTVIYINTHLFVPELKSSSQSSSPDKPSVFVFFLESLPQLSYQRFMKKTKQSLDQIGVQYLNYFVKPMENSFPNTIAMLTGERVDWEQEKKYKKSYFDAKFKYLWDDFKDNGYVTGFEEDLAIVGVFNYGKWGFKTPPCDYNPRAFWVQMYPETGSFDINAAMDITSTSQMCFHNNGPKIKHFLDHSASFVGKNRNKPYFLFTFFSQATHNDFNSFQAVDKYVADFMESVKHDLNNTILTFAGDHGFRMDSYIATSMGRVEERMNLVSIHVPDDVHRKYPHLRWLLHANENSLVTWYDVHKMLQQIATGEFKSYDPTPAPPRGPVNPMTQLIPKSRTCQDANIDMIYCVCNRRVRVPPDANYASSDVGTARDSLVDYVNERLGSKSCPHLTSNETIEFSHILPATGEQLLPIERAVTKILMMPGNLTLEAYVYRDWDKKPWRFEVDDARNKNEGMIDMISLMKVMGCSSNSP